MNRHPAHTLLLKAARALELTAAAAILAVIICDALLLFYRTAEILLSSPETFDLGAFLSSALLLIMGIGLSFYMSARLAVVFLVCTPLLGIILFLIVRKIAPMYALLQKAIDRVNAIVQEDLTAIRAVKASK